MSHVVAAERALLESLRRVARDRLAPEATDLGGALPAEAMVYYVVALGLFRSNSRRAGSTMGLRRCAHRPHLVPAATGRTPQLLRAGGLSRWPVDGTTGVD